MNIKTEIYEDGSYCTIIQLKSGLEIELHGDEESLTISNPNVVTGNGCESFDFSVNPKAGDPESGHLKCDGFALRDALDSVIVNPAIK